MLRPLQNALLSFYNFLVGDMRILIGTLLALLITWLMVGIAPALAGIMFVVLVVTTTTVSIWREITP